jgi:hypothetical protein
VFDITEPCDFDPLKPPNKFSITTIYETPKLTKRRVTNVES